ncbi:bifunctional metallophosphatase/5'-nucleotidase [Enterococcus songbeiensis]|uniref:bifunctional metallophosphatase/5'-nucleotidase n=1 Tax=Enterococcus songbeiensis TaxID=2559927 RepID=UPI0010F7B8D8|nr:bifunctional UDP-sugar hydrolase/5'-nucleotidase [Enterococcus songbeiensis]
MEKIVVLHTNDLHSHLENWPKIRRYIDQRKREVSQLGATPLAVDLGDFTDRWHPLSEATNGQANVQLMNQIHYDAATIGNNEGVGNSKEELDHLYDQANFDVLLANLYDKATLQLPSWAKPYKIITTPQGSKVGLIALTAPFPLTYAPNGWDIRQPMEILANLARTLRPQVDLLILMSHLGIEDDQLIANELPMIDLILGSHTHHLFKEGKVVNDVQLAAAGKFGRYIGEVTVTLDDQKQILHQEARTIETSDLPVFPEDQAEIDYYMEEGHRLLKNKVMADLPVELSLDPEAEHALIKETLAAVKERGKTEAALLNTGLFLAPLPKGIVDQDQLHTTLPHPMHLIRVTLKGRDVIRLVAEIEKNRNFLRNFPILGMGFRGKIFGQIVYDGIFYDATNHQVYWQDRPIDPDKDYRLTTVDHLMFVPFFPTIEIAGTHEFLFPEFIRSVLGNYLHAHYPIL